MTHHGESKYPTGDRSPEEMRRDLERHQEGKRFLVMLEESHSDAMKTMFSEFTRMCREIESMGIDPMKLSRVWRNR